MQQVGNFDCSIPASPLGINVGQFRLSKYPLSFQQPQKGQLALRIKQLGHSDRFAGLGQDQFLIPLSKATSLAVIIDGFGSLIGQFDLNRPQLSPGSRDTSAGGPDGALVAVEQRHRQHHLDQPLILRRANLPLIATHQRDVRDRLND